MSKMKLGIISLGCAKNLIDSELILGLCTKYDLEITSDETLADVIIVNTCGFIESAKEESLNTIMEAINLKYDFGNKIVIVTGCLVQRYLKELSEEIPEVDYFVPISSYDKLDEIFMKITKSNVSYKLSYTNRVISTGKFKAYLRIGDGCNNCCAYCAIPLIRGSYRSRPIDDIIEEAKYLERKGIKELTLISQDTSRYGTDFKTYSLATLLERLALLNIFESIRVLYLYPDEITDEMLEVFKKYDSICKYFDIPIQHASNRLLEKMNRRGTIEDITKLCDKIRNMMPEAILRTTIIVGFPGETDEDFDTLCKHISSLKFERLGAFTYSDEEGTKGYLMNDKIPEDVKEERFVKLMEIQSKIALEYNKSRIGKTYKALVDSYDNKEKAYKVRTYQEAPDDVDGFIFVKDEVIIGTYINIEITDVNGYDLYAKVIK